MPGVNWKSVESGGGEVLRPVPWRLGLATLALAGVASLAGTVAFLLASDGWSSSNGSWVIAWGVVATLFGVLAFRNLVRLLRRTPIVGYDATGLYLPDVGRVAWDEIRDISVDQVGRERSPKLLVGIRLHDHRAVLSRAGLRRRVEGRLEVSARRAPLAIHHFHLPVQLYVLAERLERRREEALRKTGQPRPAGRSPNSSA